MRCAREGEGEGRGYEKDLRIGERWKESLD